MIEFSLPFPPTVNAYYRSLRTGKLAGRVLISQRGRDYRDQAIAMILNQGVPLGALMGKICCAIKVYPPDKRRRDLDNLLKPVLDVLHHARVIRDDSDIDILIIRRCEQTESGGLRLCLNDMINVENWEQIH